MDRYLLRELLVPLGYCLGGFLIFYIAFDLIFQINRFLEAHLLFWDIVQYYIVTLPELLVEQVIPVSLLLALLYTTTNHSRYNEITAMRAAGVSLWRLAAPYFAVGAVFGVGVFLIGEFWLSSADSKAKAIMQRRLGDSAQRDESTRLTFANMETHRDWNIDRFNRRTYEGAHLKLETARSDGSVETVYASRVAYRDGQWVLNDAVTWLQKTNEPAPTVIRTNAVLSLNLPETPAWILSEIKFNTLRATDAAKGPQFSMHEIRDYLRLHPGIDADKKARLLTQLQEGLARPFTCLAVVLIALPFGARAGRRNVFAGVASSIFICFAYFVLQKISIALGLGGVLPPVLAAWLPNIVCGGAGLALLANVR
ncbi:MAG TPA: LptF/LptG family permease [Verrucomicrobiae bacterium]